MMRQYDAIIIGSGIAALTVLYRLYDQMNVIVFTKANTFSSNSYLAQGGVAVAMDKEDHWSEHYRDTMVAGIYHNHPEHLEVLTKEAQVYIKDLIKRGMKFDRNQIGEFDYGQEGGHLKRRIIHAGGDATGKVLTTFMFEQVKDKVKIIENEMAINLITHEGRCVGVTTKNKNGELNQYLAPATIVATGGCGGIYEYTSNAETITGDGMAMAYRAGANLTDMEFVQFHPTVFYKNGKTIGLISEAVRGEGAFLQNSKGERFMETVHELKDLAPRDIVARAIFREIQKGELVYLNIANVKDFRRRFPNIFQMCVENGMDIRNGLLPVMPGAHFMMGGIQTDERGRTSVKGLYAVGEVACTGVHGANRIASNSLLEGIVFGNRTAEGILNDHLPVVVSGFRGANWVNKQTPVNLPTKQEMKAKMTKYAGVERSAEGLEKLKTWLEQYPFLHINLESLSLEEVEIVNMLTVAWLIATSALERKESLGSHFRIDFPESKKVGERREIIRQISYDQKILVGSSLI
ncbi:L-aspartate oxidase [Caldibacillus thermoamylovorans]|uniref:L-aspartate oxidase n=2 Tax=Caldibacillus thermoamylovorans TaxID=35841 RepID=A0ABD4A7S8_9BACI|nr:L-aspartate oxidase [Caldibacillus thermoamylovorans]KIO73034.1 L-aspartate oxidase [Caldibacillus thermoamylovorans]